ncbi:uncharacterized protein LOC121389956 [Gigantopelta aegis]|uniref:uncharacterized protein LOC121389956 n=1 Tax=Gigantopelta aegis TaxID=1735272 RepID=UPI001B88BAAC|nr:uncharacterized protein LOC121389956 [Gigantopelta aegis]
MTCDLPCISYMAIYVISLHIVNSNSRSSSSSNHWRLDPGEGKVRRATTDDGSHSEDDLVMDILKNKVVKNGEWRVETQHVGCDTPESLGQEKSTQTKTSHRKSKRNLTCGRSVNTTQYDHLRGVAERKEHSQFPEPEVAMIFQKKGTQISDVDMNELEERLWKAKKQKTKSIQLYNQIGNFWRIKGNTQLSIDCFRKALSISPDNPDVLLNLARVLFNLQYLDDAIFLTRRSLMMQPPNENSWLQHFTLGEILKAYGHFQEASLHFRHSLELNPGFQPAQAHLREMESTPSPSVTQYTLFIILFLVLGVLFGVITSIEANFDEGGDMVKTQRHFNRAMAMRSIKLGINPRLIRMRKLNC